MTEEAVFGVDVSTLDADRLVKTFLKRAYKPDIERALYTGKWFDYRFMNPVAATYQFAHEFKKVYRREFKRNIDSYKGEFITPLPDDLFNAPATTIGGIWRARQIADAMGMPYEIYLDRAYHWALSYWKRKYLPRPCHLYSDLVTDRTAIDWVEHQHTYLYYSKLPQYLNVNYDARVKTLDDHRAWLRDQLALRHDNTDVAATLTDFIPQQMSYN
jgi:hypothetical protein